MALLRGLSHRRSGHGRHVSAGAVDRRWTPRPACHGGGDHSIAHWIQNEQKFATNIFHINADVLPSLYFRFGEDFFKGKRNIGYWAWELSQCPREFDVAINMMDEIWGISEFVTESFRTRSKVPVVNMPLAVSLPTLTQHYTKTQFGLDPNCFQFLFNFDAASYLERKNPLAVIQAFKRAFPRGDERVRLLLKTMNVPHANEMWRAVEAMAAEDSRIRIMDKRLSRDEVLGLNSVCDAFVSLHRSEGFGRNIAEAMLLGKPVVSTNYSGSVDFAKAGTACVVDYKLIPVPASVYPFWKDQVWADPDTEHAADLMRRLARDEAFRTTIARAGQAFVKENFNEETIGARYAARIDEFERTRVRVPKPISEPPEKKARVEREDEAIVENVQRGIRSRFYSHGRYSPTRETGTHHFHRLLAEFFAGSSADAVKERP